MGPPGPAGPQGSLRGKSDSRFTFVLPIFEGCAKMARAVQLTLAVLMNVQVCKVQWATKGLPVLRDSQGKLGTQALRGRAAQDDRCSQGGGGEGRRSEAGDSGRPWPVLP